MGETPFKSASDLLEIPTAKQPTGGQGLTLDETGKIPSSLSISAPTGSVVMYVAATAPSGWLICDGSSVLRSSYASLFAVIGTAYGSVDGTHFTLPDMRGRVPVGYTPSGGHTDVATLGNSDALALANRRPKHKHTVNDTGHTHAPSNGGNFASDLNNGQPGPTGGAGTSAPTTGNSTTGITVGTSTDNGDAPPYQVFNMIIKT